MDKCPRRPCYCGRAHPISSIVPILVLDRRGKNNPCTRKGLGAVSGFLPFVRRGPGGNKLSVFPRLLADERICSATRKDPSPVFLETRQKLAQWSRGVFRRTLILRATAPPSAEKAEAISRRRARRETEGFGARANPVIRAAPRGLRFRPRASGGTVGFDCRVFALRFGPPPSRSGQSSYFGHAPEGRDLWFSSPYPGNPDPYPPMRNLRRPLRIGTSGFPPPPGSSRPPPLVGGRLAILDASVGAGGGCPYPPSETRPRARRADTRGLSAANSR